MRSWFTIIGVPYEDAPEHIERLRGTAYCKWKLPRRPPVEPLEKGGPVGTSWSDVYDADEWKEVAAYDRYDLHPGRQDIDALGRGLGGEMVVLEDARWVFLRRR